MVSHYLLKSSNLELSQFQAFSTWLHQEISTQSSESDPSESLEKGANIDYPNTLAYIQGASLDSQLSQILDLKQPPDGQSKIDLEDEGRTLFDLYKTEIGDDKPRNTWQRLPGLGALISHLDHLCNTVFTKIISAQKRNIRFGTPINLGTGDISPMDMRMIQEVSSD